MTRHDLNKQNYTSLQVELVPPKNVFSKYQLTERHIMVTVQMTENWHTSMLS